MKKLIDNTNKIWNVTSLCASVFLVLNMIVIVANIITRRFFNTPIFGSTEMVSYASLITASLALAQNEWFDGNIEMTIILEMMPKRAEKILHFVDYIICSVAFTFISYLLFQQAANKFASADYSQDLKLPVWIFTAVLAVGFVLLTICMYLKTVVYGYAAVKNEEVTLRPDRTGPDPNAEEA